MFQCLTSCLLDLLCAAYGMGILSTVSLYLSAVKFSGVDCLLRNDNTHNGEAGVVYVGLIFVFLVMKPVCDRKDCFMFNK